MLSDTSRQLSENFFQSLNVITGENLLVPLLIQASPHPLLIAPRNHAGDLLDSIKVSRHHINKIIESHHVYLQIYERFLS